MAAHISRDEGKTAPLLRRLAHRFQEKPHETLDGEAILAVPLRKPLLSSPRLATPASLTASAGADPRLGRGLVAEASGGWHCGHTLALRKTAGSQHARSCTLIWFIRLLILAGGITLTGLAAAALAAFAANTGMLGTCFEGACSYVAIFNAFPALWSGLFIVFVLGWAWQARRRAKVPQEK